MKVFKDLYIYGDQYSVETFFEQIYNKLPRDWEKSKQADKLKDYLLITYSGRLLPKAMVSLNYSLCQEKKCLKIGNIVPIDKSQLTMEEYNKILDLFLSEVVIPYCEKDMHLKYKVSETDIFDPLVYISNLSLKKLIIFCINANKNTGSAHPCDEERWFDFICQTVNDDRVLPSEKLKQFLMDTDYWEKKGTKSWDEKIAEELTSQYEICVDILKYFIKCNR